MSQGCVRRKDLNGRMSRMHPRKRGTAPRPQGTKADKNPDRGGNINWDGGSSVGGEVAERRRDEM